MKRIIPILLLLLCVCTAGACAAQGEYNVSSLSLNSLSINTLSGQETLSFGVAARKSDDFETPVNVQKATEKTMEYFFIGLVLPDNAFWVDLNPRGLTKIMESDLADTDMGRVMLAADLRLKKDTCELTNPQKSKTGRAYWDRLYAKADALGIVDQLPVYNRVWIVPGEVRLIQSQDQISIARSSLSVCFEADAFAGNAPAVDAKAKQLQEYAGQLMRELIIPELNKRVNESRAYTDLRQVYNALILARAYKQKVNLNAQTVFRALDARAVLADVEKSAPLDKDKIYKDYLKSLRMGEYNFQEDVSGRLNFYMEVITRQYMSGGIDLRAIKAETDYVENIQPKGHLQEGTINYSFDVTFTAGIARPLAAAKQQLAAWFSDYNETRKNPAVLSVDNLPPMEPRSRSTEIAPYGKNFEIMLRHL
jgi:hypothetical protein